MVVVVVFKTNYCYLMCIDANRKKTPKNTVNYYSCNMPSDMVYEPGVQWLLLLTIRFYYGFCDLSKTSQIMSRQKVHQMVTQNKKGKKIKQVVLHKSRMFSEPLT